MARKVKMPKIRNHVALIATSRVSAGPMRDRRKRRKKDKRNNWSTEEW